MANKIGKYKWLLIREVVTFTKEGNFGQEVKSYTDGLPCWAKIEESNGSNVEEFEQVRPRAFATITIRGLPQLKACDRLRIKSSGVRYVVGGIHTNLTETIVSAYRVVEV